jgi:OmpA-OmpF porin, OOP family
MGVNRLGFEFGNGFGGGGRDGVRNQRTMCAQTAPLIDHTNQLEDKTAANNRQIHDVDDRAQAGIKQAQGAADLAGQNAQNAGKAANDAGDQANLAVHRADTLDSVVKGWITTSRWPMSR